MPMTINRCDITIPKISMRAAYDFEMRDKYDNSQLPEEEINQLAYVTSEQLLNSPDDIDSLERFMKYSL